MFLRSPERAQYNNQRLRFAPPLVRITEKHQALKGRDSDWFIAPFQGLTAICHLPGLRSAPGYYVAPLWGFMLNELRKIDS
jgi:hypothetical protein